MRGREPFRDLADQPKRPSLGQLCFAAQDGREIVALDVLHRDVRDAVDLAHVVNAHDVLVRDLAGEEKLVYETFLGFDRDGATLRVGTNDLQRHRDAEFPIPRLIHRAHAADAEQPDDVVTRSEGLPYLERSARLPRL